MFFKKLKTQAPINVNISDYMVKWGGKCRSNFQYNVKQWLKPYWFYDVCLEELRIPGSLMTVDFVNITRKIMIETSGNQHREYNKHFHKGSRTNFLSQIKRDMQKQEWAAQNDFVLVEIFEEDLPLTPEFFKDKYGVEIC